MEFIKSHKGLVIGLGCFLAFVIFIFVAAEIKVQNEKKEKARAEALEAEIENQESELSAAVETAESNEEGETDESEQSSYQASLGVDNGSSSKTQIKIEEESTEEEEFVPPEPIIPLDVTIFDHTDVPKKNMDGSSCKTYFNAVKLADFGTYWGGNLTNNDILSANKILVGVEQNPDNSEVADLQSTGWLIENFDTITDSTAVKFTNLHVIGSLSSSHVALLCSYDWYSAFGMTDTLVVFEDISGTLNPNDFSDGDVFEATVFKHNMKIEKVNGKRVLVVEYNTYSDWVIE